MSYDHQAQTFIAVKKKATGTVDYSRDLTGAEKRLFDGSRAAEFETLVALGAIKPMSVADSRLAKAQEPEQCIPTDWVDRWKPQDSGSREAKSRIVILGWRDPCLHEFASIRADAHCRGHPLRAAVLGQR